MCINLKKKLDITPEKFILRSFSYNLIKTTLSIKSALICKYNEMQNIFHPFLLPYFLCYSSTYTIHRALESIIHYSMHEK